MSHFSQKIILSQPRTHIRVTLPDNRVYEAPIGTTANELFQVAIPNSESPIVGAICDGQLRELNYPIMRDLSIAPVLLTTTDGARIYRRSLVLLLATAVAELWDNRQVSVRYSVPDGGYYCKIIGDNPLSLQELDQLDVRMRQIVADDSPITKRIVPLSEAKALFAQRGDDDKVQLLTYRTRPELTLYNLRGRDDYYFGYMLPSTGLLKYFRLVWGKEGFILQYPRRDNPTVLRPIRAHDKLTRVFHQSDEWSRRLNIEDIGRLNRVVDTPDRLRELILVAEAFHEQNVATIARDIVQKHVQTGVRFVFIAGPSSSGKTTFSKRLAIQLLAQGLRPFTLELDNYFVNREDTPRDAKGDYNFEALEAINLSLFNSQLLALAQGETVQLPKFNFITGKSEQGALAKLTEKQIIIIEGIHGLNPRLINDLPTEWVYRVYVSALTQVNIDLHNRVSTTDTRLLRRIVRDARTRGYNATDTLNRWESVRNGERTGIFPYQENADAMFDSALIYELAALRPLAEPLLLQVKPNTSAFIEAKRLLSFLGWVRPIPPDQLSLIPDTSLLREFIGHSILDDYHPLQAGE
ncbi:MAG: nucleoside kinase [Phototrophicales bacterium]|nr:MAG: nucleoside kinase [Phototrophicales bacterium]